MGCLETSISFCSLSTHIRSTKRKKAKSYPLHCMIEARVKENRAFQSRWSPVHNTVGGDSYKTRRRDSRTGSPNIKQDGDGIVHQDWEDEQHFVLSTRATACLHQNSFDQENIFSPSSLHPSARLADTMARRGRQTRVCMTSVV